MITKKRSGYNKVFGFLYTLYDSAGVFGKKEPGE